MSSAWVNENVYAMYKLLQSGATMLLSLLMLVKHDLGHDLTIQKYSIVSKSKYLMTFNGSKSHRDSSNNRRTKRTKPPAFKVKFSKVNITNGFFVGVKRYLNFNYYLKQ